MRLMTVRVSPDAASGAEQRAFQEVIRQYWRSVYDFAFRNSLARDEATAATEATFRRAYHGRDKAPAGPDALLWLLKIAAFVVDERGSRGQHVSFDLLDETLRSEATRTDVVASLTDPQRNYLLWELKQGCMNAVLNCLPVSERTAFTLSILNGMSDKDAARTLGITVGAFKVRLSRAKGKVTDYLAARCEHVDPRNPCHCPSRLGTALRSGFISPPTNSEINLRAPFGRYGGKDTPERDVLTIFESLPHPDAPADLATRLEAAVASGSWDQPG
jgi:RNA polymerase sigma-70 factor (ECF subfamily)